MTFLLYHNSVFHSLFWPRSGAQTAEGAVGDTELAPFTGSEERCFLPLVGPDNHFMCITQASSIFTRSPPSGTRLVETGFKACPKSRVITSQDPSRFSSVKILRLDESMKRIPLPFGSVPVSFSHNCFSTRDCCGFFPW